MMFKMKDWLINSMASFIEFISDVLALMPQALKYSFFIFGGIFSNKSFLNFGF